jgi:hypothetical protein
MSIVLAVLISLLLVAIGLFGLSFERRTQAPAALALEAARNSDAVRRSLGSPVKIRHFVTGRMITAGGFGNADLTIGVEGPAGRGQLSEWAQEEAERWRICSLYFRADGKSIDIEIVPDTSARCERE